MTIAKLKIDVSDNLKAGTEFVQHGKLFCNENTCFTADLVYDSPNFELVESGELTEPAQI